RLPEEQPVTDRHADQQIGTVRDIIVDANGRAAALVVESSGPVYLPQAVYRIPWKNIDLTPYRSGLVVDPPSRDPHRFGLFPGSESVDTLPREFRLSEILGDYARLRTGYGYGIVTDAIFTLDGRLSAVLVSRHAASGGQTMAFPFLGTQGPWDPGMSYYGLPFVTDRQADAAGLKVDPHRFNDAAL
ncbi:PRC-barrel domain-containing protein, partial [Methylobacterium oxalidis]|uniref:PRC-barrel domain-containing protein n=1 Tax=Methylobacterium oxalidis TaxID=944322 RepID=UPI001EDCA309